jgi:putative acetyltransferase
MMAMAHPKAGLRPYLPPDAPLLAEIFRASIEELTTEDYNEAQQEAWASAADNEQEFAERLRKQLTLVGTLNGSPVGFITLEGTEQIGMLYVHPAAAGQGVGAMLCDAIEKLASARGASKLTVEASDSASNFFEKRGFVAQQRNSVLRGDEWLANTTMEKKLPAKGSNA